MKKQYLYLKRWLDVIIGVVLVIIGSPLFILVAILIKLDSKGPVFFRQKRLGKDGVVFELLKFRSMIDRPRVPREEVMLSNPEVTRVGKWLRRFKIDELPQLVNVIKGDMSLIGPRPALPEQLSEYSEKTRKRLLVRPGLTGLAQVNGNIYLSWTERWEYDVYYVEHMSIWLDFTILLKTLAVIILGEQKFISRKLREL